MEYNFNQIELEAEIKKYMYQNIEGDIHLIAYYSSFFDNLGSGYSDIDVYVIYEGKIGHEQILKRKYCNVTFVQSGNAELDIEFYTLAAYKKIIADVLSFTVKKDYNVFDIDTDLMKFLHKLTHAKLLFLNESAINFDVKTIQEKNKKRMIQNYFSLFRGDMDDAQKFYRNGEYFSAYMMQQKAFLYLLQAYFAALNIPIVKSKWIYRRLQESKKADGGKAMRIFEQNYLLPAGKITKAQIESFFRSMQQLAIEVQNAS